VRWLGGKESGDGPQLEVKFRGYASCTRPGFRPAGNFRLSPDKVVKQGSAHVLRPAGRRAATGTFHYCVRQPEVTVVHVLLINTSTHPIFGPVLFERSPTTALSVEYLNRTLILRFVVSRNVE
jgi:hypothetical protein